MELFFNELSATYPCNSIRDAQFRMSRILKLLSKTHKEGFNICRIFPDYISSSLAPEYSILRWLQDTSVRKVEKDFFMSYVRPPFEIGRDDQEDQFILADYLLHEPDEITHNGSITEGLAWAYICNTLSVSFPSNKVWRKTKIRLLEKIDRDKKEVSVHHAGLERHIEELNLWIDSLKTIELIPAPGRPEEKKIHLSDDHGKDVLMALAKRLVYNEYVVEIPNSLAFKPRSRSFIQKVHPDGLVDVTLFKYDQGFSMMIKTTGRNYHETKEIARLLKEKYYS